MFAYIPKYNFITVFLPPFKSLSKDLLHIKGLSKYYQRHFKGSIKLQTQSLSL